MVAKKLSSRDVKTLGVGDHADGDGLWLRVLPSGRRSWTFQYAQGSKRRKMAIGQHPGMSLTEARAEVLRLRAMVAQGKDPKAPVDAAPDVATAVAEYLEKEVSQLSANSQKSYRSFLMNYVVDRYGHLNLSQFTDRHLAALLDSIVTSGRPATASAVFRVVRRFLNWAMRTRRYIDTNPTDLVAEPKPPKSRDRVLTAAEIASIQGALGQDEGSALVRLLFLTAARLNEVAHMRWEDLNLVDGLWTIPNTKNHTTHIVPLSDPALQILRTMHAGEVSGYVISGSLGLKPYSGFSKLKRRIDEASGVTDWRFHDIRRTAATIMRRAGIDRDVVKAVLNHKVSDVTAIYDRYDQLEERKIALCLLAKELSKTKPLSSDWIIKSEKAS